MRMKHKIKKAFADVFGESEDLRIFFAPGRVNLIGEHTDYNGGHVFPCALTIGTYHDRPGEGTGSSECTLINLRKRA